MATLRRSAYPESLLVRVSGAWSIWVVVGAHCLRDCLYVYMSWLVFDSSWEDGGDPLFLEKLKKLAWSGEARIERVEEQGLNE